jgi:hypothetical protein
MFVDLCEYFSVFVWASSQFKMREESRKMESGGSLVDRLNYGVSEGPSFVAAPLRSAGRCAG